MDPRPTNDLIVQLEGRLPPDCRRALEELNALEWRFATIEGAAGPSMDVQSTRSLLGREQHRYTRLWVQFPSTR